MLQDCSCALKKKKKPIRSEKNLTAHNLTFRPIRVMYILFLENKGNDHQQKKL